MTKMHSVLPSVLPTVLLFAASLPAADPRPEADAEREALLTRLAELDLRLGVLERERSAAGPRLGSLAIGLNLLSSLGTSSVADESIRTLNGGGHDPARKGLTFQAAELSFLGELPGIARGEMHLAAGRNEESGESFLELEEAFAQTQGLPGGFAVTVGYRLMPFGVANRAHAHTSAFLNQSLIRTRFFGPDGTRAPLIEGEWSGAWLPATPTVLFGVMNSNSSPSFRGAVGAHHHGDEHDGEQAVGGYALVDEGSSAPVAYLRATIGQPAGAPGWFGGMSLAWGENAAGTTTHTTLLGLDARWSEPVGTGGVRGWSVLAEYAHRRYGVPAIELEAGETRDATTLIDQALRIEILRGFAPAWSLGGRAEYAWASVDGVEAHEGAYEIHDRSHDPLRDDRIRLSGVVQWQPHELARIRLQTDYDQADHLDKGAWSVWLGFELSVGAHSH